MGNFIGTGKEQSKMAESSETTSPAVPAMKLELVPIPVSDVEQARAFYEKAGFYFSCTATWYH
ncbi:MAG: hypothetical protein ACLQUY_06225 [Ktedonobacterales bacterium]